MRSNGMLVQRTGMRKPHSTLTTLVWLCTAVHAHMNSQIRGCGELVAASGTAERSLAGVHQHVAPPNVAHSKSL
jgi:hypothetical protein